MSITNRARAITRWCAVAVMGAAVVTATADGFVQSYAGLYAWALEHGLHGWKASSFPLMVDLLIVVGELGLFLLAIDAYSLQRKHFLTWFDFLLPLMIAVAGWTASLIFNVGHVQEEDFSYQATAAVPPIVSMLGLLVLLRTLHRYVSDRPPGARHGAAPDPAPAVDGAAQQSLPTAPRIMPLHGGVRTAERMDGNGVRLRLVRLSGWPTSIDDRGNGSAEGHGAERGANRAGQNGQAVGDAGGEPEPARSAQPAPGSDSAAGPPARPTSPKGTGAAPADPQHAAGASNGAGNAHGDTATATLRRASKARLLEELHEQQGDVTAALRAMEAEGLSYDEDEAQRARRNNWLPYVVYRLLAQHGGDVERVGQVLADQGIDCAPDVLQELARSWQ